MDWIAATLKPMTSSTARAETARRPAPPHRPRPARRGRGWLLFLLIWLGVGCLLVWQAGQIARDQAIDDLTVAGQTAIALHVEALAAEIDKQRALPVVLATDPDALAVLRAPTDTGAVMALNRKLEALSAATRAAVIYLIDGDGMTIAASNWQEPASFVGNDYGFRPYYTVAMAEGAAEHFAMGTVSHRPGMYLARRIQAPDGRRLGVMVVKIEFDRIEQLWHAAPDRIFATDARGVVLVTGIDAWRFRSLTPLPAETRSVIRASLQYGDAPLDPLPLAPDTGMGKPLVHLTTPMAAGSRLLHIRAAMPDIGWTLHLLSPADQPLNRAAANARTIVTTLVALLAAATAALLYRRQQLRARVAAADDARAQLEAAVRDRTADLASTNAALEAEMEERRLAEAAARQMQDDLVQASRLAVLGQIAASVAHEINQPVAAIRAFADNAAAFLDRDRPQAARDNLVRIAGLTDRIGAITGQLRGFARKSALTPTPVAVIEAVDGALLLLGHRLRAHAVALDLDMPTDAADAHVMADRVRLEQVLVNLIGNALDAVADGPEPRITISLRRTKGRIALAVADNGPGLPLDIRAGLFLPFRTTKPDGLGLGLVISADLVREMGGTLTAGPPATDNSSPGQGGAQFILDLPEVS